MKISKEHIYIIILLILINGCTPHKKPDTKVQDSSKYDSPTMIGFGTKPAVFGGIDDGTLTLVAWNLAGFNSIPDDRFYKLVDAIIEIDPDVIALVEVNYSYVAPALAYELSNRDANMCFERKLVRQGAKQAIAIIHRCEVDVLNPELVAGSDLNRQGLREALKVDVVAGKFDFALITIHQKAGRSNSSRNDRTEQNKVISSYIDSNILSVSAERDTLIVGDYNMIPGEDDENFDALNGTKSLIYISTPLAESGGFSHIRKYGRPGNFLDGFAISEDTVNEYIENSISVLSLNESMGISLAAFRNEVSDHLPLVAKFKTTLPDDD